MNDYGMPDPGKLVDEPIPNAAAAGPRQIDALGRFLSRYRLLIGISAIVGALAGLGLSFVLPKIYRAEVLVTPVAAEEGSPLKSLIGQYGGALASLAGAELPGGSGGTSTAATIAILKSRAFIEAFISERNLLPVLFRKQWDAAHGTWRLKQGEEPPSLQDGYGLFLKKVMHVVEDKEKSLITINVEWRDPTIAAEWANALVQRLNESARKRAIASADRSIEYLNRELAQTQTIELRASIYSLLQTQINKRMIANTRPDFAFSVIDPAQAPEARKYVSPVPLLLAALGFFAGAVLAMFAVILNPFAAAHESRSRT